MEAPTNVAEAPRAHKEVVKPNGHIRALILATPKFASPLRPRGVNSLQLDQCQVLGTEISVWVPGCVVVGAQLL